jgi:hypothetical protein
MSRFGGGLARGHGGTPQYHHRSISTYAMNVERNVPVPETTGYRCRKDGRIGQPPRVAHTLVCMYAPHLYEHNLCHRVLSAACSAFLTVMKVADVRCDADATRGGKSSAGPVFRPCGSSSGAGIFRATY